MEYAVLKVSCPDQWKDIMVAELADAGFDTMEETDNGLDAYVEEGEKEKIDVESVMERYSQVEGLTYEWGIVENQNWNEEWEKNYDPVVIAEQCLVRADFHQIKEEYKYEVVINPRMSFGTGHHPTTWLMVAALLKLDLTGKTVLDAGCGTGVLSIISEQKGAIAIDAYDISDWCVENTQENSNLNNCTKINVFQGTISDVPLQDDYDVIIANINKNVLTEEMDAYVRKMKKGSLLLLSGFFKDDGQDIINSAQKSGLKVLQNAERDNWACISFCLEG
ncbi:MAG: 50S ribosomal protein L11 methyltransferase [Cyclobacteriaceae bacterium]|nr:50S ribosomal protein L11 methyltransferase [Cyclobacteriaceae bacterium]